jgi:hypothetical protein
MPSPSTPLSRTNAQQQQSGWRMLFLVGQRQDPIAQRQTPFHLASA